MGMQSDDFQKILRARRRRGVVAIYTVVTLTALMAMLSLAVDGAHIQLVKTELQSAADAAAMYAAAGLKNQLNGKSGAIGNAKAVAAQNTSDGRALSVSDSDVELGIWNIEKRTFTTATDINLANAVRVTVRRNTANGNAKQMFFGSVTGKSTYDVSASAIAMTINDAGTEFKVEATSNPWLSGMPDGSVANPKNPAKNPDYAPEASPTLLSGIPLDEGTMLTFDGVNGGANNMPSDQKFDADGNTGSGAANNQYSPQKGAENGIADVRAPFNSLIGIFMDDDVPTKTAAPPVALDFSTTGSRNFTQLAPALKQPFFIGDGRTSTGEVQSFAIPSGTTRLFIGTMDSFEWNNNIGAFKLAARIPGNVSLVK